MRFARAASVVLLLLVVPAAAAAQGAPAPVDALAAMFDESQRAYARRDFAASIALLETVAARAQAEGRAALEAAARRRLGLGYRYSARVADGVTELRRAQSLFAAAGDRRAELRTGLELAEASFALGNAEQARVHAQSAADTARAIGDREGFAAAADVLVYYLPPGTDLGPLRREALAITGPDGAPIACGVLHDLGDEQFNEGRGAEAFATLTQARTCFQRAHSPDSEGRALVSLGRVYRLHGRLSEALAQYRAALALHERPGSTDPLGAIQDINAIAVTLGLMGRLDEAREQYETALARARRRMPSAVPFLVANLGGMYLDLGRYDEALALLDEGIATEKDTTYLARRLIQRGTTKMHLGRASEALADLDRAVELATARGPEDAASARRGRAAFFIEQGRFVEAADDLRVAMDRIEEVRAHAVRTDAMRRSFLDARRGVFGTMVELLGAQGKAGEALEVAERARARAFLDLRADRAGEAALATPATVADARRAAARLNTTIVAYWVGASATSIWVVRPDREPTLVTVPVLPARLTALVQATSGLDADASAARGLLMTARAQRAPWRELDTLLIAPIRRLLPSQPGARLTLVPHGPLLGLSFAALAGPSGRTLLEAYDLHYVPAIALLTDGGAGARPASVPRRDRGAPLVGDPGELGPETGAELPLPALPWAKREVAAIRATLGGTADELTAEAATETRVRASLAGQPIVHFATHGVVSNEPSRPSYIALRATPGGDDGRLLADEIYDLRLDADVVVLSACRTALGPIEGDGVIGLTRAFLSAGARSVVATQWDVSDRVSYEVMRGFYARRARGIGKSRALRGAQLAVLRQLRAGTLRADGVTLPEAPRLWAGFTLTGEP